MHFEYVNNSIDAININGEPWVIAQDVCNVLGLKEAWRAVHSLNESEKQTIQLVRSGQRRTYWLVNESGLYALIFKSRKPEAQQFRQWVTSEVLPNVRKEGAYLVKGQQTKGLPGKKVKHNRLTNDRLLDIMKDVVQIDDPAIRKRITMKLGL